MSTSDGDAAWRPLYRIGAISSLVTFVFMCAQVVVFVVHPPPSTVLGFFALFAENRLLGLLEMDLLSIADYTLTAIVFLAMCAAMRRANQSLLALALTLELVAVATYFASNTCFSMLGLSGQYAAATSDAERAALVAAGQAMLALYQGTAFDVSYVLSGVAIVFLGVAMYRDQVFGRPTVYLSLVMGFMMVLPPTVGPIGMIVALASLAPLAVWLVLVARRLFQLAQA